jgi:acetyl esterase
MSDRLPHRIRRLRERVRRHAGSLVVDNFFHGLARAGRLHPLSRPERHGVEIVRDVPYRDTGRVEHLLDVYRPVAHPGPWPVVLYVHGGGFRILSKDTHWIMGLAFARRGYLVFNISYRLAPRHPFPAAIADTIAAYGWVARNAAAYGGDPERMVLAGESAGANLVTSLTVATCYPRPEAWARPAFDTGLAPRVTIPACGVLQVTDAGRFRRRKSKISPFLNDRLTEVSDAYLARVRVDRPEDLDLADPLVFLERGAPPARPLPAFFAPVGTKDPLLDDTRRLKVALDRLGVPAQACYYPGELHAFHALIFRPSARRCWRDTFEFLDRHLPGAPAARAEPDGDAADSAAGG